MVYGVFVWLVILVSLWEILWKGFALWRAANDKRVVWFIVILVLNTLGVVPIIYLIISHYYNKHKVVKHKAVKKLSRRRK